MNISWKYFSLSVILPQNQTPDKEYPQLFSKDLSYFKIIDKTGKRYDKKNLNIATLKELKTVTDDHKQD